MECPGEIWESFRTLAGKDAWYLGVATERVEI